MQIVRISFLRSNLFSMKFFGQRVQQLRIAGRVGDPHVVHRLDDAAAEEVRPVAVRQRLREERVLGVGHPVHQLLARVLVGGDGHRVAAERLRVGSLAGALGWFTSPMPLRRTKMLLSGVVRRRRQPVLAADPGEERGQAPVVVLAPLLVRVMVAAGALSRFPRNTWRGVVHELLGLVAVRGTTPRPGCRARRPGGQCSRTNWSYGMLSSMLRGSSRGRRTCRCAAAGSPLRRLLRRMSRPLDRRSSSRIPAVEQLVDELLPLVGVLVGHERPSLRRRGQRAGESSERAADKLLVAAKPEGAMPSSSTCSCLSMKFRPKPARRTSPVAERHRRAEDRDHALVAGHHRAFARSHRSY